MEDISLSARIAIGLIVISVVITVIFTILGFTRGITTQGMGSFQNAMNQMSLSTYNDYDQKIMSGTNVKAAMKLFEGDSVAILIHTAKETTPRRFNNYGALLSGHSGTDPVKVTLSEKGTGESWYTSDYGETVTQYNLNSKNVEVKGNDEYIRPTAKFMSELVKSSTGDIIGIAFIQM